ncbi:DinI-like family protein [Salmonella enterica]|uniref:DinI-like family protein n=1 Tax=Salmonella enterica TaxID=28901 RepID=UPI00398C636A
MRIEVTIAKTSPLPAGAIDALAGELPPPISPHFSGDFGNVTPRYATPNKFSVLWASKEDKKSILSLINNSEPTKQAENSYALFSLKKKKTTTTNTKICL